MPDRLDAGYAGQESDAAERHCLTFARARKLALEPGCASPQERAHIASCEVCQRKLKAFRGAVKHPSSELLAFSVLSWLTANEQDALRYHLEIDGCPWCRKRKAALETTLEALVEARDAGLNGWDEPLADLSNYLPGLVYTVQPVAAAGVFNSGSIDFSQVVSDDGRWRLTLCEEDERDQALLLLTVQLEDPEWEGGHIVVRGVTDDRPGPVWLRRAAMEPLRDGLWEQVFDLPVKVLEEYPRGLRFLVVPEHSQDSPASGESFDDTAVH